ncbi:hypothetical protein AEAC466_13855 [Asticcacaulis sp. AC466]|uniref:glycosyl hydrolase 115 family protein n=1 Tax=Asticcacaulis sp. AC466 TaxID=1282362 RepID=UPI0003C3F485|nr:glycosyl hydrolase 115 family protein [Asticcacaulis sp. AC466]ESQ83329.1 hypothetical protein AEAC466_13855 [Asticcacaulis sp. AC466]
MKLWLIAAILMVTPVRALACEGAVAVCEGTGDGFALIRDGQPAKVYVDADAAAPVRRVATDFAADLERVSGRKADIVHDLTGGGDIVIIGELGHSQALAQLGIDSAAIAGKWEAYSQTVVARKAGGQLLVIAGADPRGTIYGTYDISARMGVSPWYWWADVPVVHKANLYVTAGTRSDAPKVRYRGFFINDEEPAFGGWARQKFGGINHDLYGHVFELNLRLKGNYLWPAMWGKAFADDDPENLKTAQAYGIVMGTSHHEPMTRAQEEWHRHLDTGITGGKWDYTQNGDNLRAFWRGGIERMHAGGFENVVTLGMRGDGDEPMTEGTATQLLETIVADQRRIIADVTGKPASQTPQVWALYKEVQDYYDHGMQVPDDVTLLFSDDNWGQIRRLPRLMEGKPGETRAGGYGVYYHFDYVGVPRNYKWVNTNQIEKTWQQMDLAYASGADRLWIVNVGDIKPMEFPLSFFMDMAWNPEAMTPEALKAYPARWAAQQFGPDHAADIGDILTRYSQYNARKKPELIDAAVFDLPSLSGMERDYGKLADRTETLSAALPADAKNAYYQLVEYPVVASANLYSLYFHVAENHRYAAKGEPWANVEADAAEAAFRKDGALADAYHALAGGKWDRMMSQVHTGYDNWQQPDARIMPPVSRLTVKPGTQLVRPKDRVRQTVSPTAASDGQIAIEAEHFTRKAEADGVRWQVIPNLGRTLSSVVSLPQTAAATTDQSVRLEYDIDVKTTADAMLHLYLAPTFDTRNAGGLRIAVAIDDGPAQTLSFDLKPDTPQWSQAVKDNIVILSAPFKGLTAGRHTIKVFRIDGNVVLERLVLDTGGQKASYLGPPETPRAK